MAFSINTRSLAHRLHLCSQPRPTCGPSPSRGRGLKPEIRFSSDQDFDHFPHLLCLESRLRLQQNRPSLRFSADAALMRRINRQIMCARASFYKALWRKASERRARVRDSKALGSTGSSYVKYKLNSLEINAVEGVKAQHACALALIEIPSTTMVLQ